MLPLYSVIKKRVFCIIYCDQSLKPQVLINLISYLQKIYHKNDRFQNKIKSRQMIRGAKSRSTDKDFLWRSQAREKRRKLKFQQVIM